MKKMAKWKAFEHNAANYLNRVYQKSFLTFTAKGGSNAYANDILVFKEGHYYFSMEAKFLPAQCGQITLGHRDGRFTFSKRSRQKFMPQTQVIIDLINNHEFLSENDPRFFAWIQAYYYQKNATWFALSQSFKNLSSSNLYLCQTKDLKHYVNVNATLRQKKSGSTKIPYKLIDKAIRLLSEKIPDARCSVKGLLVKRLYVECENRPKDPYLNAYLYLSFKGDNRYEVRKLSPTKRWSVAFDMELKKVPPQSTPLL